MQASDVIVFNTEQGIQTIEKTLHAKELQPLLYKAIWNVCRYDGKSKFNIKNLSRGYLKRQQVYETRYNTLIADTVQDGNIAEILLRYRTLKEEDENTVFYREITNLKEGILLKYHETRTRR